MKYCFLWIVVITAAMVSAVTAEPQKKGEPATTRAKEEDTYSVALRIRRVTCEDAYVAVPVTGKIMDQKKRPDSTFGIDMAAFAAEAIRISKDPRVEWKVESSTTEPHPTRKPLPAGRKSFDAFYYDQPATQQTTSPATMRAPAPAK